MYWTKIESGIELRKSWMELVRGAVEMLGMGARGWDRGTSRRGWITGCDGLG